MALVKVAIRSRETLALLRVRDKVIVLQTMLWPDEVRSPEFDILDVEVELRPQEMQMAASLVDSLGAEFDPSRFTDEYRDAMLELIDRKRSTGETRPAPVVEPGGDGADSMTDLLTALQRSVEAAKAASGSTGGAAGGSASEGSKGGAAPSVPAQRTGAADDAEPTPGTTKTATKTPPKPKSDPKPESSPKSRSTGKSTKRPRRTA
jgi:DNA end-binding protein Ku